MSDDKSSSPFNEFDAKIMNEYHSSNDIEPPKVDLPQHIDSSSEDTRRKRSDVDLPQQIESPEDSRQPPDVDLTPNELSKDLKQMSLQQLVNEEEWGEKKSQLLNQEMDGSTKDVASIEITSSKYSDDQKDLVTMEKVEIPKRSGPLDLQLPPLQIPLSREDVDGSSTHIQEHAWSKGLFNCWNSLIPSCVYTTLVGAIPLGRLYEKMGMGKYTDVIKGELSVVIFSLAIFVFLLLLGKGKIISFLTALSIIVLPLIFRTVLVFHLRYKMRKKFRITGSVYQDVLTSTFCSCCVLSQMARHLHVYSGETQDTSETFDDIENHYDS